MATTTITTEDPAADLRSGEVPPPPARPDGGSFRTYIVSTTSCAPGEMHVAAHGDIDLSTTPEFHARLISVMSHPSCATVVVDLRGVRFMGARGVGVLAAVRERAARHGVRIAIVATTAAVLRVLAVTGTDGVFPSIIAARAGSNGRG